jgi:excinuclease ABC subunit A
VGLDYLTLDRAAMTLSGGEAQRIRLATQIGAGLTGVLYVLDEPSIGLHQRDNGRLLQTLTKLRDLGNTLIVVEHDEETIRAANHIVDIGPGAGIHGGQIVSQGDLETLLSAEDSLTGAYLSGRKVIETPTERRKGNGRTLSSKTPTAITSSTLMLKSRWVSWFVLQVSPVRVNRRWLTNFSTQLCNIT